MQALHLPPFTPSSAEQSPPYSFPSKPPPPSTVQYTASTFPSPQPPSNPKQHTYLISVTATALTRGELTWAEILEPSRFHPHGSAIPGHDVVGIIKSIYPASDTSNEPIFKVGDKIWGLIDFDRDGAAADLTIAYQNEIALLPTSPPNLEQAEWEHQMATLPLSALTAYQALFTHGSVSPSLLTSSHHPSTGNGDHFRPSVLILGPTGSVGIPTLYLSLAASLPTTILTSSRHLPFLHSVNDSLNGTSKSDLSFGIITHDSPSYSSLPASFKEQGIKLVDIVIDTVGGPTLQSLLTSRHLTQVLNPHAKIITLVAPLSSFPNSLQSSITENITHSGRDTSVDFFIVKPSSSELNILGDLATQGKLVGHVDAVFPLERGREAMEKTEAKGGEGRGVGKVVVRVSE